MGLAEYAEQIKSMWLILGFEKYQKKSKSECHSIDFHTAIKY